MILLKKPFNLLSLIIAILIPLAVGFLSSFLSRSGMEAYQSLIKPAFSPPGWIFAPVWTVLYILMGIASYRIWRLGPENPEVRSALKSYAMQLALNFLWSILFFGLGLRFLAFIDIILLLIFILITTIQFYRLDKPAAYLMIPYILWVSFAAVLNYTIWQLNR